MFYLCTFSFLLISQVSCVLDREEGWNYINLHCRDNYNKPVDWWIIYKPPSNIGGLESGRNFSFLTSTTRGRWEPSAAHITSDSMLQHTLSPLYRATYTDHLAMLSYENKKQTNSMISSAFGLMMADEIGGLWIGHTVPGLAEATWDRQIFTEEQLHEGHVLMCLSLDLPTLNEVSAVINVVQPKVIEMRMPNLMTDYLPTWINFGNAFRFNPNKALRLNQFDFVTQEKSLNVTLVTRPPGLQHCLYKTFARMKNIILDVYRHGKASIPVCEDSYSVRNIDSISMKYSENVYYIDNQTDQLEFAVSTAAHWQRLGAGETQYWTCTSNLEKEDASAKGGFLVCIEDYGIWRSFSNLKVKEPEC